LHHADKDLKSMDPVVEIKILNFKATKTVTKETKILLFLTRSYSQKVPVNLGGQVQM